MLLACYAAGGWYGGISDVDRESCDGFEVGYSRSSARKNSAQTSRLLIAILGRNVVLGDFFRCDFGLVWIQGVFDAADYFGFVVLAFVHEFFDALGIRGLPLRQTLRVAGLAAGAQSNALMDARLGRSAGGLAAAGPLHAADFLARAGFFERTAGLERDLDFFALSFFLVFFLGAGLDFFLRLGFFLAMQKV